MSDTHRTIGAAWISGACIVLHLLTAGTALGATVEEALRLRDREGPDKAAAILEGIWHKDPGNLEAGYNLGLCLLESGVTDSAATVLDAVAQHKDIHPSMRRDALYNLGLARALAAQELQQMRPAQAKELYGKAIQSFRDALSGPADAGLTADAGYNIEAAWRLLAQLEQQMQQQSSSGMDSLAQQLQDLTSQQQDLQQQTQKSSNPQELQNDQQDLQQQAQDLAEQMQRKGMEKPAEDVQQAQQAQSEAAEQLAQADAQEAAQQQDQALDHLRDAMAALLGQDEQSAPRDSTEARRAAEELAKLNRDAEKQRQQREAELRKDPRYRPEPATTGRVEVEKNW
jgi:chemotaxis protein histidine kinase CheA